MDLVTITWLAVPIFLLWLGWFIFPRKRRPRFYEIDCTAIDRIWRPKS